MEGYETSLNAHAGGWNVVYNYEKESACAKIKMTGVLRICWSIHYLFVPGGSVTKKDSIPLDGNRAYIISTTSTNGLSLV